MKVSAGDLHKIPGLNARNSWRATAHPGRQRFVAADNMTHRLAANFTTFGKY
jgi:hypothetical protein